MNCISTTGRMPHVRRAGGRADDRGLARSACRSRARSPKRAEQAVGHLERAAVGADVLAEAEHVAGRAPSPRRARRGSPRDR